MIRRVALLCLYREINKRLMSRNSVNPVKSVPANSRVISAVITYIGLSGELSENLKPSAFTSLLLKDQSNAHLFLITSNTNLSTGNTVKHNLGSRYESTSGEKVESVAVTVLLCLLSGSLTASLPVRHPVRRVLRAGVELDEDVDEVGGQEGEVCGGRRDDVPLAAAARLACLRVVSQPE